VNLSEVIESLVEERGLDREKVIAIVCEGIGMAYDKKFPGHIFHIAFNKKTGNADVYAEKEVVEVVEFEEEEITPKKAKSIDSSAKLGDYVKVPFEEKVGRIEILAAKQLIANKIRELEALAVCDAFKDKEGTIVTGAIHKRERAGWAIKMGDVIALLPSSNCIPEEALRVGYPVRALLQEVLPLPRNGYQLILDRASADFVKRLIELEIPEVFEGLVEVKKIVRIAGYKTKIAVVSNSKDIDPVGTCVGVGGARIKPILKELGKEKIDLLGWSDDFETLIKGSLKPAEIDKVEMISEGRAMVWLAEDQRSFAIGKMGQNIALAAKLSDIEIQLQDLPNQQATFPVDPESDDEAPFSQDDE
jgi:transcription termination/antitermination protein NusA